MSVDYSHSLGCPDNSAASGQRPSGAFCDVTYQPTIRVREAKAKRIAIMSFDDAEIFIS
jgi:hypothetical protein